MSFLEVTAFLFDGFLISLLIFAVTLLGIPFGVTQVSKFDLNLAGKFADFFEVSIDYLLGRTDELGNIAFTAPALPAREQQLLADFRSLAPALQEMLLATIETWKGSKANASTGGKRA